MARVPVDTDTLLEDSLVMNLVMIMMTLMIMMMTLMIMMMMIVVNLGWPASRESSSRK